MMEYWINWFIERVVEAFAFWGFIIFLALIATSFACANYECVANFTVKELPKDNENE